MTDTPENAKTYDPKAIEGALFSKWLEAGYFRRDAAGYADMSLDPFTIVIPPPNVTGLLHMGHALNNSLQDMQIRKARMQKRPTRWITGTDHAGIATQNRVEAKLASEGLTRFDLGREAFVEACWEWRELYGRTIIEQLKLMGCSCDYEAEQFTMDEGYNRAIRKVFVDWYHAGLVYRGLRIINWCPRCTTALADDEVNHIDRDTHLWYIRYPLLEPVDNISYVVVATTRPETMLGDSGVAVNPDDPRYSALLKAGAQVRLPLTDRIVPIVADEFVDSEFGTGAVKVTPAHDPNDFELGQKHNLEQINIFTPEAVVNETGGRFAGLSRDDAREAVVAALEDLGLIDHIDEYSHSVGCCYRCDTIIEPWASEQWFVSMQQLAAPAIEAAKDGRISFHPARWQKVYFHWMDNIRDWCISRQLWWGHRIPVFYCDDCGWVDASEQDIEICPACGATVRQDEDVLDTWFSSQLWPFATVGWPDDPNAMEELSRNYPTQVLSTARDIIFLWVARMIMSSMYFLDNTVPFTDVFLHPTVLDRFGNIMSKSRGNGVDPTDLIDLFGADVMRFGLAAQVTGIQDIKFDQDKLDVYRNFTTKIFNASRFVFMNLDDFDNDGDRVIPEPVTAADSNILSKLATLTEFLNDEQNHFEFGAQSRALYSFFWNEFCDWYIEFAKSQLADPATRRSTQKNLVYVLDIALRLLHPSMPFITEDIWLRLPHGDQIPSLVVADWPKTEDLAIYADAQAERSIDLLIAVVTALRSTRARYQISPRTALPVVINATGQNAAEDVIILDKLSNQLNAMANYLDISIGIDVVKPEQSVMVLADGLEIHIVLAGLIDFDAERTRLVKEFEARKKEIERLQNKLNNEGFITKAAADVVQKSRDDLERLISENVGLQAKIMELQ
ncbi:MAG: valine--tRNA ligase [Coriobacteriia bacterium]|nr:valine--tRNA ligase [Coriobacteriia bacterium]